MKRSALLVLAAVLAAVLALSGCSGSSSDDSSTASGSASSASDSAGGAAVAPAAAPEVAAGGAPAAAAPVGLAGRSVVRTGDLDVTVGDVPKAADEARRLALAAGGTVDSDERSGTGARGRADVLLRVPPRSFDAVLGKVAGLGEETGRSLGSEDVTDTVVDLQARLDSQRASVERVRALLDRADTLGEVVSIEGQLTKRTADLESLEARVAALRAQVDLASLTVHFVTREGTAAVATGPRGFGDGLRGGWDALVTTARAAALVVGALLPFSPLLLLLVAGLWWRTRRPRSPAVG